MESIKPEHTPRSLSERRTSAYVPALIIMSLMLIAGLTMLIAVSIPEYRKALVLDGTAKSVTGTITGVYDDGEGGDRYAEYSYDLRGASLNGQDSYNGAYNERGNIKVYYLPRDPGFSAINPRAKVNSARIGIQFLALWNGLIGLAAMVVLAKGCKRVPSSAKMGRK